MDAKNEKNWPNEENSNEYSDIGTLFVIFGVLLFC